MYKAAGVFALTFLWLAGEFLSPALASEDDKLPRPAALVPAYFYPAGKGLLEWERLAEDAKTIKIEVILDPANGPGVKRDPAYVAVVRKFREAGGRVLGYITSSYGKRALAKIEDDLRKYLEFYEIDGVFLDEMTSGPVPFPYYEKVHRLIKGVKPELRIVGNPGQPIVGEAYMGTVDCLVLFEGDAGDYAKYRPQASTPWMKRYPANRFANIVHTVASPDGMRQAMEKAAETRAGWLFITDRRMPNPYDALPAYWAEEREMLIRAPQTAR
jgi:hypothetical protein